MNKKFVALLLIVVLIASAFLGCTQKAKEDDDKVEKVESVDIKKVLISPEWIKSVIDG